MSRSRSSRVPVFAVVLSMGLGGCVSSGVLQNAEVLPPRASATGLKLARYGSSLQALASYRRGLTSSVDVGIDAGFSMLRVDPKVQLLDGAVDVAVSMPLSCNLSVREISYPVDEKKWVVTGIPGAHPALIVGVGRFYIAASGSYYPSRAGWRPTGTRYAITAPRWHSYGVTLGYQSAFTGPDSTRIAAEIGVVRFPGWKTQVLPSLTLQFPLGR